MLLLVLGGCGSGPSGDLPPPGADQAGTISVWPPDAGRPYVIAAERIEQVPDSSKAFTLYGATGHSTMRGGQMHLAAAWATNDDVEPGKHIRFSQPVHLHGDRDGRPFHGRAELAWITDGEHRAVFTGTVIHYGRRELVVERLELRLGGDLDWEHGPLVDRPAAPWWQAVSLALPRSGG